MWSGNDQYSQWALNPSAYQNVAHDKVDWAALAQQWIQMKDTLPEDQVPPAPPPPPLGKVEDKKKDGDVEGGEAPMEVEKDDLESSSSQDAPAWGAWNNWQQWGGWGWNASSVDPAGGVPPPTPAAIIAKQGSMVGSTLPVPGYGYSGAPGYAAPPSGNFDYNQTQTTEPYNQVMVGSYWASGHSDDATSNNLLSGPGPAPFIRNSRQDWRRGGRGHDRTRSADKSDEEEDSTIALDAAKRRQLPAWIREGLEKMEREKQKKIDRDRQLREREIYLLKKREEEEEALNEMQQKNSGQPMVPKKSKFESDSEESDHGDNRAPSPISTSRRKSRFRNADSPASSPSGLLIREPSPEPEPVKTREEILHEKMLYVRRLLTEILLEVTTEEMESVAQEVLSKAKAKAPALQLRKTPALASLTGKLGLGIYGDSDESDSDDSSDDHTRQINGADSDEELMDQIQRRKQEFTKTEREIEARLQEEEEKERDRERRLVAEVSDDDTGEERQVEKQSDSKRPNAHDGIKIKEEHDKTSRSTNHLEPIKQEDNSHYNNNDHCSPPHVKKERKSEDNSEHSSDLKMKHHLEAYRQQAKGKRDKSVSSDENEETSSKSDSGSSSSSKSASSSSLESRRSSKKSSKNSQSLEKRSNKKISDRSDRIHKKSDKKLMKSKDRKREYGSKELKVKDRKKEKHRKPRSRSRSGRSHSKETRKIKRSHSGESRRSRRSRSRESYRSKTDRRESQSITSRDSERRYSDSKHGSHKSHDSHSKSKSHDSRSKEKVSYKYRDSRSPVKEKRSARTKKHRSSSLSRSPRSKSHRYLDKKDSLEVYSRSRSNSTPPRPSKKSRRHRSSSSSENSSYRAKGKTAGR